MDWAEDKIGYPNFDTRVRGLGSPYIHDEWRPLISAIFASSDPSNEDPRSPSALVEEAMQTHSVSFDKNEGQPSMTSGMYPTNSVDTASHSPNLAGSLLKDPSAWRLIMDWAEDKIGYPDFDTKIRELRSPYIHGEWKPLIDAIFASSDPSNEDSRPPPALVEEAMRTHGVRFAISAVLPSVSASQPNPSQSAVRPSSGRARQQPKRRKANVRRFLNLAAEDEDEDEDEDNGEARGSVRCPIDQGPSGKETFDRAVNSMIERYSRKLQPQDVQTRKSPQIPEGVPIPLPNKLFIVDLFSGAFTSW